jgi:hypothetical protein
MFILGRCKCESWYCTSGARDAPTNCADTHLFRRRSILVDWVVGTNIRYPVLRNLAHASGIRHPPPLKSRPAARRDLGALRARRAWGDIRGHHGGITGRLDP